MEIKHEDIVAEIENENVGESNEFNMQQLFNSKIHPHLEEIKKICKVNNLPFFFSAAIKNEKGKTKYVNDGVLTGSNSIGLYNDMFEKFLLVMHGAKITFRDDLDEDAVNYIMSQYPSDEPVQEKTQDVVEEDIAESVPEESEFNIEFIGDL